MKTTKFFIIAVIVGAMLTGCSDDDKSVKVTSITLNTTETIIPVGKSEQLSVTGVLPSNATEKGVIWSSGNTACATVDAVTGMITVPATASTGTVNITATAKDGSGVTATCVVTVIEVGMAYQGGKIAYIDATGKHGLIAAHEDQCAAWSTFPYIATGARLTVIGTGKSNTDVIVAAHGAGNYAANLCKSLNISGYTDWYLPSKDELNELYKNKYKIGGFINNCYWSSSEFNTQYAWKQNFLNGVQSRDDEKGTSWDVRAVRSF